MKVRLGASVLGLLLTGCDLVLTRKQELEYVWKRPFQLTLVRGLFVLSRYMAIIIHIADIALASFMTPRIDELKQNPGHLCLSMVIFRLVSCQSMLLILHLILMLRVFALYNQSLPVGIFLLILIVVGFAGLTVGMVRGFTRAKIKFTAFCSPKISVANRWKNPILYLACGEIVIQLILLGLAWKRIFWDFRRIKSFRPALISVLNRDGLRTFAGIAVALVAISVAVSKRGGTPAVFIFPLLITFISISGTRTILNLQALSHEATLSRSTPEPNREMELTTVNLTRWEEPWSTTTFLDVEQ
ncbi:hypothetical protein GYMLUDRAFT_41586 [Collybiopsis luxurians FD-317 M1]|uniref:DUF6533 domain-containing protein n=1 Tax=Collybiopsis luxurians FD-317 M1 TaxID=944289 RepID=A0A0D0BFL2_9AGAR|nr:hypothetical protein GYMLUDRAFT_41586 [Collybiopsis luxurians FD-317 M1]